MFDLAVIIFSQGLRINLRICKAVKTTKSQRDQGIFLNN